MTDVVYTHQLKWKETKVNLAQALTWIKDNIPHCTGTSANYTFEVHFTQQPTEEHLAALDKYWAEATDENYVSNVDREKALLAFKKRMLVADMKNFGATERKILMNMELDPSDWETILG